jgi:hypothetical protein
MIEEVKEKWIDISNRTPSYLSDFEFDLVKDYYIKIKALLIRAITNTHFNDNQIDLIYEKIDTYHTLIRRAIGDKIFIMIWADDISFIEEMIEDCSDIELYEGAHNLKRILDKINA